ncbi:NUDIX hydrolase N-terminal domain-containing protein [Sporolactobacillus terrae]|uniref:NUDIX hydrolase N-terminal domain-containing protein n=1 Tax=Sporolactobacillus terrae TaxID=269673 RepID=UPI000490DDF1|nr:NUDIX hydrolase [Sporolactobacillus terrae]
MEQKKALYKPWLDWAIELQSLAQAGLAYSKDRFDQERFTRIREIAAEMLAAKSGMSLNKVSDLFCNETGYQTPKLDTRAAIFQDEKIVLVKENNGVWSLPGGWVDVDQSIKSNTKKEVKEEAGLEVEPMRIIAIHDRNAHNRPRYAYGVCKVFVQCRRIGGQFQANSETTESRCFALDELPPLAEEKNTKEQIQMCFAAYHDPNWTAVFD